MFRDYTRSPFRFTFASFLSSANRYVRHALAGLALGRRRTSGVVSRGATLTSSASGVNVSSGFFFAFMMLGSVA